MPRLVNANPKYCRHKGSDQAYVTLDAQEIYLGPWGTKTSKAEYDRVIAEWLQNGRRLPRSLAPSDLSIAELVAAFWQHAQTYYRKPDGTPTTEVQVYRDALRPLNKLYGHTQARDFGPLALKAVRAEMVALGWCRTNANKQIGRLKHVFKWATENEMIPATVYHGLMAVEGLRRGRSEVRESAPVRPVPDAHVEAVLPFLSPTVAAMVRLQLLTGMRPGEVCAMRGADIAVERDPTAGEERWTYRPGHHKTAHHGHERIVPLGPKSRGLLQPYLKPDLQAYVFSPTEAEAARREAQHTARTTPPHLGNSPGTNRKSRPKRKPGEAYDVASYRRAVARACDRAFPAPGDLAQREDETDRQWRGRLTAEQKVELAAWQAKHRFSLHRLRHSAATRLRRSHGIEAVQAILGHKTLSVSELYAEVDFEQATRIMQEVG